MASTTDQAEIIRSFLSEASAQSSWSGAAVIGVQLAHLAVNAAPATVAAAELVRSASLQLFRALHLGEDVEDARQYALTALACLEAVLPTGVRQRAAVAREVADTSLAARLKLYLAEWYVGDQTFPIASGNSVDVANR